MAFVCFESSPWDAFIITTGDKSLSGSDDSFIRMSLVNDSNICLSVPELALWSRVIHITNFVVRNNFAFLDFWCLLNI